MKTATRHARLGIPRPESDSRPNWTAAERTASVARIYEEHFDFVWRNARRLGIPAESIDDVVQDVFVVVHRRLADFDGQVPVRTWIFAILVRVVGSHRRRFRRKGAGLVSIETDDQAVTSGLSASDPTPSDLAEQAESIRLLDHLLDQIGEQKRLLLILSELEEWTLREIAELLNSNTNTVYSQLRSARQAFDRAHARWRAKAGEKL